MKYKFSEEEILVDNLALEYDCPQCPDEDDARPTIHFDRETVEILLADKIHTAG